MKIVKEALKIMYEKKFDTKLNKELVIKELLIAKYKNYHV